eukprot:3294850-Pyramimonas_sp.AAC.2
MAASVAAVASGNFFCPDSFSSVIFSSANFDMPAHAWYLRVSIAAHGASSLAAVREYFTQGPRCIQWIY